MHGLPSRVFTLLVLTSTCLYADSLDLTAALTQDGEVFPSHEGIRLYSSSADEQGGGFHRGNFLRLDEEKKILLDAWGPGILRSIKVERPVGVFEFTYDQAEEPQWIVPAEELFSGELNPFLTPFFRQDDDSFIIKFPFPFEKGLQVAHVGPGSFSWELEYDLLPSSQDVISWIPDEAPTNDLKLIYTEIAKKLEGSSLPHGQNHLVDTPIHLFEGDETFVYTASESVLIDEIFITESSRSSNPSLWYLGVGGEEVPWPILTGNPKGLDRYSLAAGSLESSSWWRVPFFLEAGESLTFRFDTDSSPEFIGNLLISGESAGTGATLRIDSREFTNDSDSPFGIEADESSELLLVGALSHNTYRPETLGLSWRAGATRFLPGASWAIPYRDTGCWIERGPLLWGITLGDVGTLTARVPYVPRHEDFGQVVYTVSLSTEESLEDFQRIPSEKAEDIGRVTRLDSATTSTIVLAAPPVSIHGSPQDGWLDPGDELSGDAKVTVDLAGLNYLGVHLDLPHGWTGTLAAAGEDERSVFDIGWPSFDYWSPEPGEYSFQWSVTAPETLRPGLSMIQLRALARYVDGKEVPVTMEIPVMTTMAGETRYAWGGKSFSPSTRTFGLSLPEDFQSKEGDFFTIEAGFHNDELPEKIAATLAFNGQPIANSTGFPEEDIEGLPPSGLSRGRLLTTGKKHELVFWPGQFSSWMNRQEELSIQLPMDPEGRLELTNPRIVSFETFPVMGRRTPYRELRKNQFVIPKNEQMLFGDDLYEALRGNILAPGNEPYLETRRLEYLENVTGAPVGFQLMTTPEREELEQSSLGVLLPFRYVGERVAIYHESIRGATSVGVHFGYGPQSGWVGVRDCEGRLAGVHDLSFPEKVTFPQYLKVDFYLPSRDPFFYLEALSPAVGSLGVNVPIQRVYIFKEEPEL